MSGSVFPSGEIPPAPYDALSFTPPGEFHRKRQMSYWGRVIDLLATAAPEKLWRSGYEVHVLHPAGWLARHTVAQELPGQVNRRWLEEPDFTVGWFLRGVVEPSPASVSKERGPLLLLDDARYTVPSRFNSLVPDHPYPGIYVPTAQLQPLSPDMSARLDLIYDQLHALATPEA